MRFGPFLILGLVACTEPRTTNTQQAVETSCGELPPVETLDRWDGHSLFAPTHRAVTLSFSYGTDQFIAYGVDVDAQLVAWAMTGPRARLDGLIAANDSAARDLGVISTIVLKGGGGEPPPPPGEPPWTQSLSVSPEYLVSTATAMTDSVRDPLWCE